MRSSPAGSLARALAVAALACACRGPAETSGTASEPERMRVGAARVDITPEHAVRLSGYAARSRESEGVAQPIFARALALQREGEEPVLLISVDSVGVPGALVDRLAGRLAAGCGLARERLCVASTHTHSGPHLPEAIPNMFGGPLSDEHAANVARYGATLEAKLDEVARAALASLRPGRLALARGSVGFAANRRTAGGPVDRTLPLLSAADESGALVALVANYACHCTTLGPETNLVHGDWAGCAALDLESAHPGVVALITIGCGADANPMPRTGIPLAEQHGRALADEVERLLAAGGTPLAGPIAAELAHVALPFDTLPTPDQWRERAAPNAGAPAYHARKNLERLERGEALPTELDYTLQTWRIGDDLAMVFLAGEVVVDYALRLEHELDASRLWITAYANDVPCYIPSERVLAEGGYEAADAMIYYDKPTRLAPGLEERIVAAVKALLPRGFREVLGVDVGRTEGIAPRAPERARDSFRTPGELAVEPAAAEPLVESPIAIDFGPDGRLWVVEMRDYPLGMDGAGAPGGRIKVLEDKDGDGRYERASVFLDGLPYPTGVLAWRDGALVCAAPDVLYARDLDHDGRADSVEVLLRGFRTDNYQARVNSLAPGLDGWIYGASGLAGSTATSAAGTTVELGSRDFRFRPDTGELEPALGLTQHGRARNDWGDWFGCDNSTLAWHFPLAEDWLRRNPYFVPPAAAVVVPGGADPNRLFPVSPILARFNDLDMAGRTTSACGLTVYRDDWLGDEYAGNLFVCEPVHNLVHRLVLSDDGATFSGDRAAREQSSEFLASTDPWFRPVQVRTGPDGALWVVDMYRFVIEHPDWIPPQRLAQLDVRAGASMGRIWRVVPRGRRARRTPSLAGLGASELARALDSPNGTRRDQVQLLLTGRAGAPASELRGLCARSRCAAARAQALATLAVLGVLLQDDVERALADEDPGVRRAALRCAEPFLAQAPGLSARVAAIARSDPDAKLRMQAAVALWSAPDAVAADALAELLREEQDEYVRAAAWSALLPHLPRVLALALDEPGDGALAAELVALAVRSGDPGAVEELIARAQAQMEGGRWLETSGLLAVFLTSCDRQGKEALTAQQSRRLAPVFARARALAADPAEVLEEPEAVLALLGREPEELEGDIAVLAALLARVDAPATQRAALDALARVSDPRAAEALLAAWESLGPSLRPAALDALLAREAWSGLLLAQLEARPELRAAFDPARRAALLTHRSPEIRARAVAAFQMPAKRDAAELLARYDAVRALQGSAARGAAVFGRICASCHALEGQGKAIGPDLAALSDRSTAALLIAILDPNRAINPQYVDYRLRTLDGRSLTGIVVDESPSHVTLKTLEGVEVSVLRADIEELYDTRLSLMPDGLESELPPADMADLIAYLQRFGDEPRRFPGNEPKLVEPDAAGVLELSAATCRIHGSSLVFEPPFRNLGYWSAEDDRAQWDVRVAAAGEYDVELEYACEDGVAGNAFVLESERGSVRGEVAGTGTWDHYVVVALGRLAVPAGASRVVFRSEGKIRGALLDLRALRLRPAPTAASGGADPARR